MHIPRSSAFLSFSLIISCVRASGGTSAGKGANWGGFWSGCGKETLSLLKASRRSIDCSNNMKKVFELKQELTSKNNQNDTRVDCVTLNITCLSALLTLSSSRSSRARILLSVFPSKSENEFKHHVIRFATFWSKNCWTHRKDGARKWGDTSVIRHIISCNISMTEVIHNKARNEPLKGFNNYQLKSTKCYVKNFAVCIRCIEYHSIHPSHILFKSKIYNI